MVKVDLAKYGIKKTRQRSILLGILEGSDTPLTVSQIHALCQQKDSAAWLSTTYRTLDIFTENGIINKLMPMENNNARYELSSHKHTHYAVCKGCRKTLNIENCPVKDFKVTTKEGGFHVTGHRLEVYGYCTDCYSKH